jgi:hypothetical protein
MPSPWFWAHDVEADQIGFLAAPGMQLVRLSNYRRSIDAARRFAALFHSGDASEAPNDWVVDADAEAAAALAEWAIAVTADVVPATGFVTFTLVLQATARPGRVLHAHLDGPDVTGVLGQGNRAVDLATYELDGARRFAVLVEPTSDPSSFHPAVAPGDVRRLCVDFGARPSRIRAYATPMGRRLAITTDPNPGSAWFVGTDESADDVGARLHRQRGRPLDLDATGVDDRIRFTMLAVKDQ